jgi:hypothetical protein
LFELLPTGFEPTGPYATTIVSHAFAGTVHENVIVVPDLLPSTVTLPRAELLMTTSACVAPWRFASVTFLIVPVIVSPTRTFHFVRFSASPVCGRPPVGRSRLPGAMLAGLSVPAPAEAVSANSDSASVAVTSNDFDARGEILARARSRTSKFPIAAVPPHLVNGAPEPLEISP